MSQHCSLCGCFISPVTSSIHAVSVCDNCRMHEIAEQQSRFSGQDWQKLCEYQDKILGILQQDNAALKTKLSETESKIEARKMVEHCICRFDEGGEQTKWCLEHAVQRDKLKQQEKEIAFLKRGPHSVKDNPPEAGQHCIFLNMTTTTHLRGQTMGIIQQS